MLIEASEKSEGLFNTTRGEETDKNLSSWWFQIFCIFTPIWGKIPILTSIFQRGWFNHQLAVCFFFLLMSLCQNDLTFDIATNLGV